MGGARNRFGIQLPRNPNRAEGLQLLPSARASGATFRSPATSRWRPASGTDTPSCWCSAHGEDGARRLLRLPLAGGAPMPGARARGHGLRGITRRQGRGDLRR